MTDAVDQSETARTIAPITFAVPEAPEGTLDPDLYSRERVQNPLRHLHTFTIVNEAFARKEAFDAVDIVVLGGSSGVGKTTIFAEVKRALEGSVPYGQEVLFPERDVNRPPRDSDVAFGESRKVEDTELLDSDADYAIRWLRNVGEQTYAYGFKDVGAHTVVVLSGNNALLKYLSDHPELMMDSQGRQRVLRIGVFADEDVRERRFIARSGHEISAKEIAARLADPTAAAKDPRLVDLTIDNSEDRPLEPGTPSWPVSNFKRFLERLAQRRSVAIEMGEQQVNDYEGTGSIMRQLDRRGQSSPETDSDDK